MLALRLQVDDDTYFRIVPFLRWIREQVTAAAAAAETDKTGQADAAAAPQCSASCSSVRPLSLYFGLQNGYPLPPGLSRRDRALWESRQARVIRSPRSAWYMYDLYPHRYYPPFHSGPCYGLTRAAAHQVVQFADNPAVNAAHPEYKLFRTEDTAIAIFVEQSNEDLKQQQQQQQQQQSSASRTGPSCSLCLSPIEYRSPRGWNYRRRCLSSTILDNPAWSPGFNMYRLFRADVSGRFCSAVHHQTNDTVIHMDTADDIFAWTPKGGNADTHKRTTTSGATLGRR